MSTERVLCNIRSTPHKLDPSPGLVGYITHVEHVERESGNQKFPILVGRDLFAPHQNKRSWERWRL